MLINKPANRKKVMILKECVIETIIALNIDKPLKLINDINEKLRCIIDEKLSPSLNHNIYNKILMLLLYQLLK